MLETQDWHDIPSRHSLVVLITPDFTFCSYSQLASSPTSTRKIKPKNENEPVKILPRSPPPTGSSAATSGGRKGKTPKHMLSHELHISYSRLTTDLLPLTNKQAKHAAALPSLQYDAGLENLLPYLVRWVGARSSPPFGIRIQMRTAGPAWRFWRGLSMRSLRTRDYLWSLMCVLSALLFPLVYEVVKTIY